MSDTPKRIQRGSFVWVHYGTHKGKTGEVMTAIPYGPVNASVLISFDDGTAAYCNFNNLEVAEKDSKE